MTVLGISYFKYSCMCVTIFFLGCEKKLFPSEAFLLVNGAM